MRVRACACACVCVRVCVCVCDGMLVPKTFSCKCFNMCFKELHVSSYHIVNTNSLQLSRMAHLTLIPPNCLSNCDMEK